MSKNIRRFKDTIPKIPDSAYIDDSAVLIGDICLGEDSSVWCNVTIRGDVNHILIGERSNIQDGSVLHVTHKNPQRHPEGHPLIIGDDVTVGHNVTLHGCYLEDCSFVGMSSTVMDGAVVESRSMVGAGALVTAGTVVESGWLYLGVPAKKARQLTLEEMDYIPKLAANYVQYALDYKSSK
jgi:carbonic anhydrase/acetyltransferase-like protein (isoleucine patch superfamily)